MTVFWCISAEAKFCESTVWGGNSGKASLTQVFHCVALHSTLPTQGSGLGFIANLTRNNGKQPAPGRVNVLSEQSLIVLRKSQWYCITL